MSDDLVVGSGAGFWSREYQRSIAQQTWYKVTHLSLVSLVMFMQCGIIYGWPPLLLALDREQVYAQYCDITSPAYVEPRLEDGRCIPQLDRLNLVYTISSSLVACVSAVHGIAGDRYGAGFTTLAGGALSFIGFILMSASSTLSGGVEGGGFDGYLWGPIVLGVSVGSAFIPCFGLSARFPGYESTIFAIFNGAFDSSTGVFYVFELIHAANWVDPSDDPSVDRSGVITLSALFAGYAVFFLLIIAITGAFWLHSRAFLPAPAAASAGAADGTVAAGSENTTAIDVSLPTASDGPAPPPPKWYQTEVWQLLLSRRWVYLTIYASVGVLRSNAMFGTIDETLKVMDVEGGTDYLSYITVFSIALPFSFVWSPLVGRVLDRRSLAFNFMLMLVLSSVYGVLELIPILPLQVITFIVFTAWRVWFYSATGSYVIALFGFTHLGALLGPCYMICGVVSFLQSPLVGMAHAMGAFWPLHLILLIVMACVTAAITKFIHDIESRQTMAATVKMIADEPAPTAAAASASSGAETEMPPLSTPPPVADGDPEDGAAPEGRAE